MSARRRARLALASLCFVTLVCSSCLGSGAGASEAGAASSPPEKRIVEIGWDCPSLEYASLNLSAMEKNAPFLDGFACKAGKVCLFANESWTEDEVMLPYAAALKGSRFTDIFLRVEASSVASEPDWFDDGLWSRIAGNAKLLSRLMASGGFKGIMIDPEFYYAGSARTRSPWLYSSGGAAYYSRSFDETRAEVRARGKQLVEALQADMPELSVFLLFGASAAYDYQQGDYPELAQNPYALLPSFIDGLLDGASAGTEIVDGSEGDSYYLAETRDYDAMYGRIETAASSLLAEPKKWQSRGRVAYAIYVDYAAGYLDSNLNAISRPWGSAYYDKWIEHNVYNSLLHSDRYVWLYGESGSGDSSAGEVMNWWSDPPAHLPEGIGADIRAARTAYASGAALFDMYKSDRGSSDQAQFIAGSGFALAYDAASASLSLKRPEGSSVESVELYANSLLIGSYAASVSTIDLPSIEKPALLFARVIFDGGKHAGTNLVAIE